MRAQLFSFEFLMTLLVFFSLLYTAEDLWNATLATPTPISDLHKEAVGLSQILLTSPGEPVEWNSTNVSTLGLSYQRNVLNSGKLAEFLSLSSTDYEEAKRALGTAYDFYFAVRDSEGTLLFETEKEVTNYSNFVSVTRHCFLDNEEVIAVLALGEE